MARLRRRDYQGEIAFIGDEVSAAGWRLGGATVYTPSAADASTTFQRALATHPLLLLSAELARTIPADLLHQALRGPGPLLLILPDLRERTPVRDLATRLRRELGMRP